MNIIVVDVAAEKTGALSVLTDFYNYVKENPMNGVEWFFFTSVVKLDEADGIHVIQEKRIKKSWIHRIVWEYSDFRKIVNSCDAHVILSLQNKSMPVKNVPQVVYFHNALHLLKRGTFNIFNKFERYYCIYCSLVTPITMRSLNQSDLIITQTNTIKSGLEKRIKNKKIICIPPAISTTPVVDRCRVKGFVYPCGPLVYKKHEIIIESLKKGKQYKGEIIFTFRESDNVYAERLASMSKGLSNVKFIGFQERGNLLDLFCDHGLIFASDIESFPVPFVEAMAYGAPIIARNMPYAREILADYSNVEFFNDSDDLSEILQKSENARRGEPYSINIESPWAKVVSSVIEISK
ncbi:glycosyltransferase family 1 protein [Clostridiaceae bacterium]|nr:glycosyltransferase family 1 protein [Clostridiaceae bacterium]RKI09965.1 glycosyltransferase family 1 protein [bacterium 1XD21-70]